VQSSLGIRRLGRRKPRELASRDKVKVENSEEDPWTRAIEDLLQASNLLHPQVNKTKQHTAT